MSGAISRSTIPSYNVVGGSIIQPIVVVVQGLIGCGKSTLLEILAQDLRNCGLKVVIIPEPVELWKRVGALMDFYKHMHIHGNACKFQMFAFATRINHVRKTYAKDPNADIYIIERNPESDYYIFAQMLYNDGLFDDVEMEMYKLTWEEWMQMWPFKPTHTLMLDPSVKACMDRVAERARAGEDSIPESYQQKLLAQHEIFIKKHCGTPVYRVQGDADYRKEGSKERLDLVQKFKNFVGIRIPLVSS